MLSLKVRHPFLEVDQIFPDNSGADTPRKIFQAKFLNGRWLSQKISLLGRNVASTFRRSSGRRRRTCEGRRGRTFSTKKGELVAPVIVSEWSYFMWECCRRYYSDSLIDPRVGWRSAGYSQERRMALDKTVVVDLESFHCEGSCLRKLFYPTASTEN